MNKKKKTANKKHRKTKQRLKSLLDASLLKRKKRVVKKVDVENETINDVAQEETKKTAAKKAPAKKTTTKKTAAKKTTTKKTAAKKKTTKK